MFKIKKKISKRKGFTLVELLMVISIISLLSSIILTNLSTAREKARISSLQQYFESTDHAIRTDLIGEWKFNSSNETIDTSGFGQNLKERSGVKKQSSGGYNGKGDYLFTGSDSLLYTQLKQVPSAKMTLLAWIKLDDSANRDNRNSYTVVKNWGNNNPGSFHVEVYNNIMDYKFGGIVLSSNMSAYNPSITVTTGKWHLVGFTADGSKVTEIVDGVLGKSSTYTGTFKTDFLCLGIGAKPNDECNGIATAQGSFKGEIDDVRLYSSGLSLSEIQKVYAEGLEKHNDTLASK